MQPPCRAIGEEVSNDLAAMDRQAVPDDYHPARHFTQEAIEKRDHVMRVDGAISAVAGELARGRDGPDGREGVASAPRPHDRHLAQQRVGTDDAGPGIKPDSSMRRSICSCSSAPF
jgi:hypothetical protein